MLDTHALLWLVNDPDQLPDAVLVMIGESQQANRLYVSPISAWELGVAALKAPARRPNLGDRTARQWFTEAVRLIGARVVPIHQRIAQEAADVANVYANKDPGDCFLIATARVRRLPIITRDQAMWQLADQQPDYLTVIRA